MDEKKLEALMKDEGFTAKLAETETKAEAQKLFADNGVQFTIDELEAIKKAVEAMGEDGELDESKLDDVNGGMLGFVAATTLAAFAIAVRRWKR